MESLSLSSLQLSFVASLDLPREKAAAHEATLPGLDEYAEIEPIKVETHEKLYLNVCIDSDFEMLRFGYCLLSDELLQRPGYMARLLRKICY